MLDNSPTKSQLQELREQSRESGDMVTYRDAEEALDGDVAAAVRCQGLLPEPEPSYLQVHPARRPLRLVHQLKPVVLPETLASDIRHLLQVAAEDLTIALQDVPFTKYASLYGSVMLLSRRSWGEATVEGCKLLVSEVLQPLYGILGRSVADRERIHLVWNRLLGVLHDAGSDVEVGG